MHRTTIDIRLLFAINETLAKPRTAETDDELRAKVLHLIGSNDRAAINYHMLMKEARK